MESRTIFCTFVALTVAASLTGCNSASTESSASPSSQTSATQPGSSANSAPASTAAASPTSGVSNGQPYTVNRSSSGGATPDGKGRWNLAVDLLAGGDARVVEAFNSAVQASAAQQLEPVKRDADPEGTWTFETDPKIYFGGASVAELISGLYSHVPAAHPVGYTSTVVVDSRSAKPITLGDLFTDKQAGLNRLSEQTKILLPGVMGTGPTPMPDEPGNEPKEANFANWIPTPAGLEIHFADYQFVHGSPVITVPWSALDDVLAPGMADLRKPS
jgi:hypothetical protein